MQTRTASVRQCVAQRLVVIATRDAIGKCVQQQIAHRVTIGHATRCATHVQTPAPALARLFDRCQRTGIGTTACATAATVAPDVQSGHAQAKVIAACLLATQRRARFHQCQQVGNQRTQLDRRTQRSGTEARRCAQFQHPAAERRNALVGIECAEAAQQFARLCQRAGRWWIQPWQLRGSPGRQFQREAG